jgi:hypothetical protein
MSVRPETRAAASLLRTGLQLQGPYYIVTGVWAVVHRRSFEAVSGAKTDYWLVRMVGALAAAIGTALTLGAYRRRPAAEATVLAAGAATSFAIVDGVYAVRGRISRVYLVDLVVQALFIALLAHSARLGSRRRT